MAYGWMASLWMAWFCIALIWMSSAARLQLRNAGLTVDLTVDLAVDLTVYLLLLCFFVDRCSVLA